MPIVTGSIGSIGSMGIIGSIGIIDTIGIIGSILVHELEGEVILAPCLVQLELFSYFLTQF